MAYDPFHATLFALAVVAVLWGFAWAEDKL